MRTRESVHAVAGAGLAVSLLLSPTLGVAQGAQPARGSQAASPEGAEAAAQESTNVDPHGGGTEGAGLSADLAPPPEDGAFEDPSIPKGVVEVHVQDPLGKPMGKTEVTLSILYNSVAKGESRKRVTAQSDERGISRFRDLETGSGVAYRPTVVRDGATFSMPPFPLAQRGMHATLHVYPVTNDISQTLIVTQSMTYTEVKDDRVQIQQAFKIYNFGRNAWVPPTSLVVPLPENFTAFATQPGASDVGVDSVAGKGVKLRGTFTPGQHVIEFKWQLPYAGEANVAFESGMPPHLAAARIIAPAARGMGMAVEGFEPPKPTTDGMGQRALITERQIRREEPPVTALKITINGLPTEGPGKIFASLLALTGVLVGLVVGSRRRPERDLKRERQQLLVALEGLEKTHREGAVGPKTYERARRELIDDIARTFSAASTSKPTRKRVTGSRT